MATKRQKAALLLTETLEKIEPKNSGLENREEQINNQQHKYSHQPAVSNSLKIKLDHLKTFTALTENQQVLFDMFKRGDYCMGVLGSAGTGKTFCTLYKAIEEVLDKSNPFRQVVIVRSCVPTRDVGFLPGSLEEKQEVYELPYKEAFANLFDRPDAYERLKEQGYARFVSTTAIRGISIDDAIIVVDECASMTFHELCTIITRVGYRSKIVFVGDWRQNDLLTKKNDVSGLPDFLRVLRSMKDYSELEFSRDDIVRSSLVRSFIIALEDMGF
jgi:predicted ribonuclease YlaK